MKRIRRITKNCRRDERGTVTVELALFATIMMLVSIPVLDLAKAIHDSLKLTAALRAGVMYAYRSPTDTAGIEAVTRAATNLPRADVEVTNTQFCLCSGQVSVCTETCADGSKEKFMTLTTNYSVPLIAGYPGLGDAFALSKTTNLRIE